MQNVKELVKDIEPVHEIKLTKETAIPVVRSLSKKGDFVYFKCYLMPDVAQELKKLEKTNRSRRLASVRKYARYIVNGKWKFNPDPIIFDSKAELKDGGHSLDAVVLAGRPAPFVICCGFNANHNEIIDEVTPRNAVDVMQMSGYKGSITSLHSAVMRSIMVESPASLKITMPKLELVSVLKQNYESIEEIIKTFGYKKGLRCIRIASVMAPVTRAYLFYRKDMQKRDMIKRFIGILTGDIRSEKQEDDAPYKLRDWLLVRLNNKKNRPFSRVIYRTTEKALWNYLNHISFNFLTESLKECFPVDLGKNTKEYFNNDKEFVNIRKGRKRLIKKKN